MNEYKRPECYELLSKIIDWNSMLKDNQEDMELQLQKDKLTRMLA